MNIGQEVDVDTNVLYGRTFAYMALATLTSLVFGWTLIKFVPSVMLLFTSYVGLMAYLLIAFGTFYLSRKLTETGSFAVVGVLLVGALYGLILGPVLTLYSAKAITAGFGSGTILFAVLFAFGKSTKHDLSSWGTQLNAALVALIIVSLLAAVLRLGWAFWLIDIISVIIFAGYTIYDSQRIGQAFAEVNISDASAVNTVTAQAAIDLYVDFISLVINLIEVFGGSDNN